MLVEVRIDGRDLAQLRLVQVLHDLKLDLPVRLERSDRFREGADDRGRAERIGVAAQVRLAEQIAEAAVQHRELVVTEILDDARDVALQNGFVHRQRFDECQLGRVDLGKIGFGRAGAGDAFVDERAQLPFELRHQRRPLDPQRVARVEEQLLLVAHVGIAGAVHQQVAYPVEDLRERRGQPMHGQIPTLVQDPRDLLRRLSLSRRLRWW